jgi:hypothetical protein
MAEVGTILSLRSVYQAPLCVNDLLLSHAQDCSAVFDVGEELLHVEFDILRWHRAEYQYSTSVRALP